jgi:hypothetical protein
VISSSARSFARSCRSNGNASSSAIRTLRDMLKRRPVAVPGPEQPQANGGRQQPRSVKPVVRASQSSFNALAGRGERQV